MKKALDFAFVPPVRSLVGLRATTGKHASSAKKNPHQSYHRRLSVAKKNRQSVPPALALP